MHTTSHETPIASMLEKIAQALDITEAQYEEVIQRYEAVADHLASKDSPLIPYSPDIKPQGSFLFGTMIRPIIEDDELDVDLVCRLKGKRNEWTQADVKKIVGDHLKRDANYQRMLEDEGNRCWTLSYHEAAKFHMDILPAIIERSQLRLLEKSFSTLTQAEIERLSINITDKSRSDYRTETESHKWLKSNPWGYAGWFKKMSSLDSYKFFSLNEAIDPLPGYSKEKAPLLRIVQIFKRHRDIMFGGDDCKPISIIITTLAAKAYQKETDLLEAINNILTRIPSFIEDKYSPEHQREIKWISNPVNDCENFADRWVTEPDRQIRFFDWLDKAKNDFGYLASCDSTQAYRLLKELLGTRSVNEGVKEAGMTKLLSEAYQPIGYHSGLLTVAHRQQPTWPLNLKYNVEVHGWYKTSRGSNISVTSTRKVPKGADIYFNATTSVPKPFDVFWQVVNTGQEATQKGGLRGGIMPARTAGKGGLNQKEYSSYTGLHWVECFIVKNGFCVARSYEFFVNIE